MESARKQAEKANSRKPSGEDLPWGKALLPWEGPSEGVGQGPAR